MYTIIRLEYVQLCEYLYRYTYNNMSNYTNNVICIIICLLDYN